MTHPHPITIHIDQAVYHVESEHLTAEQLRQLPSPPIGGELDLWLEVPGPHEDRLVGAGDDVPLKSGMHFFTAPSTIAPGRAA